jgi:putative transposase
MPAIQPTRGMKLEVHGRLCTLRGSIGEDVLLIEDDLEGTTSRITLMGLQADIMAGSVRLKCDFTEAASSPQVIEARLEQVIAVLPAGTRAEMERRRAYVMKAAEVEGRLSTPAVAKPLIAEVAADIGDRRPPSPITLYRWLRDYLAAQRDVRALIPMISRRGNRKPRLPVEVYELTEKMIRSRYMRREGPAVRPAHDGLISHIREANRFRDADRLLPEPSLRSVYRQVKKMDAYEIMAARRGKWHADQYFRPVDQSVPPTRPLERVEIDHTKTDIIVVDMERRLPIGRAWLTWMVDVFSRLPVGFYLGFIPPSAESVQHCLKHMITPKTYVRDRYPEIKGEWPCFGVPETIVVDNGMEFHSRDFEDACAQLGINIHYTPRRSPWMKGTVERSFRTASNSLFHGVPGTTFSNILARGDYNPNRDAVIDKATLLEMLHTWIIDVYAQSPHRGIKDTPLHMWQTGLQAYPVRLLSKALDLDVAILSLDGRHVFSYGIEFHHLRYNSDELALLRHRDGRNPKVQFKYDPSNLGCIHVIDPDSGRPFPVTAINRAYAEGLSLWEHKIIVDYARKELNQRVDGEALRLAREQIRSLVEEQMGRKRPRVAAKAARYQPPDLPPEEPTLSLPSSQPIDLEPPPYAETLHPVEQDDNDDWDVHFDLPGTGRS